MIWINNRTKKPEDGVFILVFCPFRPKHPVQSGVYSETYQEVKDSSGKFIDRFTHWCIPVLPEGKNRKLIARDK